VKQTTKQRIVGSVVLLALALIFLPLVFDGEGSYQQPISSRIPEPPVVETLAQPIPTRPVIRDNSINEERVEPLPIEVNPSTELTDLRANDNTSENAEVVVETITDAQSAPEEPNRVPVVESQADVLEIPPGLDANGLPQGWSVRLGSFESMANANNLLERLRTAGYKAYSRKIISTQGELTGVFVGPWVERAAVDGYRQQLQQDFQLSGIIVRFEVDGL